MLNDHHARAVDLARLLSAELVGDGALAVAVVGSVATGEDHRDSDLDLIAITERPAPHQYTVRDGRLVSLTRTTPEQARDSLRQPWEVGMNVPGWRTALVLDDPSGQARRLRDEAAGWTWDSIADECDAWAASAVTDLAEEVHKLVGLLRADRRRAAAVNRDVLVMQLAGVMAVRRRLLYATENRLWDLLADTEGAQWAAAQDTALGLDPKASHRTGCLAALRLYSLAAGRVWSLLDDRQTAIVAHARELTVGVGAGRH